MLISKHAYLTDEAVRGVKPPVTGEIRLWDVQFKGFMARVWPSGRKSFCVRYRRAGKTELFTIGTFESPWTTQEARNKATEIYLRHADSQKPARDQKAHQAMTVNQLCDQYLSEGPLMKVGKRLSSWNTDISILNRHVRPLIGKRVVADLKRSDIARLLKDITDGVTAGDVKTKRQGLARVRGGPGCAWRGLTSLKAMLNWAVAQDFLINNPAKGLTMPKSAPKERFLSDDEAFRLFAALRAGEDEGSFNSQHANLIRLLLLTGARKSELMGLRWQEIDVARNRLVLPPERTKSGRHNGVRRIPLSGAARSVLTGINHTSSEFVFPADRNPQKHMTGIDKTWKRACASAQLGRMRLHDLRHSFASFAIANGENIVMIAAALGHATTRMTERYLHLRDDDVHAVAERTGQRIMLGPIAR